MGKTRRGHKEFSKEQTLKHENRESKRRERDKDITINQLIREVSSLRRQLARVDLDRHSYVKEIVDEHLADQDKHMSAQDMLKSMKNKWKCHEKGCDGHLEIVIYSKMGLPFYYRHCSQCLNRTKAQKYNPDEVEGIVKDFVKKP